MTRLLKINPENPEADLIRQAAQALQKGELVAFPTETVYGLGANALDALAVQKIFAAKARPAYDPLIVHLACAEILPRVAQAIPEIAWQLAEAFWPGPLTLILPRQKSIPHTVTAGLDSVAVRVPSHPVAQALLRAADLPVAAPSANRFGYTSPTTAQHVLQDLGGRIALILDGGATQIGVESTVLDLTHQPPRILRPGGVTPEALLPWIPNLIIARQPAADEAGPPSPGLLPRHYAPRAHLILFSGAQEDICPALDAWLKKNPPDRQKIGLLLPEETYHTLPSLRTDSLLSAYLGSDKNLPEISQNLYAAMRFLDAQGVEIILAHTFPEHALGRAINNRLRKAAAEIIPTHPERKSLHV